MPPYIEFIAGMFPANIMRKPAIISSAPKKGLGAKGPGTNGLHN
jgi:hypothetical protein